MAAAPLAVLRHRALPPPGEALSLPFLAFPSWFLRIECDRCGRSRRTLRHNVTRDYLSLRTPALSGMRRDEC
jgi:hypothetical protein